MPEAAEASNAMLETFTEEEQAAMEQALEVPEPEPEFEPLTASEPEPEPEPLAASEPAPAPARQETVPHAKFHAERERRKALQAELEHLRAQQPQTAAPSQSIMPEYVDPIIDPDGYRRWAEFNAQLPMLQAQQLRSELQAQQEASAFLERLNDYDVAMKQQVPDYDQAVQWVREQYVTTLTEAGFTADEAEQQLRNDTYRLCQAGEQAGMSPAKLMYMRAFEMGYNPTMLSSDAGNDDAGAQAPTTPQMQRVQTLNKAQQNAQTLTQTGEAQAGQLTVKTAAEMSEAELAKLSEEEMDRLLSGG